MISFRHLRSVLLLSAVMPLVSQCSPHAGKSMLHFFFDGVPESDSTGMAGKEHTDPGADTAAIPLETLACIVPEEMLHYPYGERECAMCHDERSLGNMVEPQPGLCYLCHEDLAQSHN